MYPQNAKTPIATALRTTTGPGEQAVASTAASVAGAVKELSEQATRARNIADNIFGSNPETAQGESSAPSPGTLGSLNFEVSCLFSVISDLRNQLDRLSCL